MVDGHIDRDANRMTDKEIIKALECDIKYADGDVVEVNYETIKGALKLFQEKDNIIKIYQAEQKLKEMRGE
jgi:hypothetical protein